MFLLSVNCKGSNSFLYINVVKMYPFKAKDSEMKPYPLCLGITSKNLTI